MITIIPHDLTNRFQPLHLWRRCFPRELRPSQFCSWNPNHSTTHPGLSTVHRLKARAHLGSSTRKEAIFQGTSVFFSRCPFCHGGTAKVPLVSPSSHPFLLGIFPWKNHPQMGTPHDNGNHWAHGSQNPGNDVAHQQETEADPEQRETGRFWMVR